MRKIMITGGLGFIGSNLIQHWKRRYEDDFIINVDAMTYAARPKYLEDISDKYELAVIDIRNREAVAQTMSHYKPDAVIHLAAESHVCRSIKGPSDFIHTNVVGTFNLLEEFRRLENAGRFHHVSTDEVYGQLAVSDPQFTESTPYAPTSPYSASKAGSDMIVRAYAHTYGIDTVITNCSNNFGPNQHTEKLVPKTIESIAIGKPMQVYGTGHQIRDWLYVGDHCEAIDLVFHRGKHWETYLVGGDKELTNLELINNVFNAYTSETGNFDKDLMLDFVNARPTDDFRYAIDCSKLKALGWKPNEDKFFENLKKTVRWYVDHNFGHEHS